MNMRSLVALTIAALISYAALPASPGLAQSASEVFDGVITGYTTAGTGELQSFTMVNAKGQMLEFKVQAGAQTTAYGLENQAGDRWVSDQSKDPVEAVRRLRDHQERFAPVTVTARDGVALSVVEKEGGRLETNLGYLFAIYTVTWLAFFGYVFILSRRQRDLQREIARLKAAPASQNKK
ncbi:MAG: CcmD family protein [Dehalococcoidia bacterium]|nr:CcmD family protein [Dehalococcoidia bacterium]MSQ35237.1 CcmD family protein [Dehalococcoidia bacterium]